MYNYIYIIIHLIIIDIFLIHFCVSILNQWLSSEPSWADDWSSSFLAWPSNTCAAMSGPCHTPIPLLLPLLLAHATLKGRTKSPQTRGSLHPGHNPEIGIRGGTVTLNSSCSGKCCCFFLVFEVARVAGVQGGWLRVGWGVVVVAMICCPRHTTWLAIQQPEWPHLQYAYDNFQFEFLYESI